MFDLELDRVVREIQEAKAKKVVIQLPDGLKPRANEVVDTITHKTDAEVFIFLGSCFGACDIPLGIQSLGIDLMIQFGHNKYHKTVQEW